ncbi:transposase [Paenibacillus dendritiformis]|uniref:IS1380 family transposase n=1 Tax=Paenibacillus dendritiformis TaxID=130049 RepID=UPI0018CE9A4A|nr:transposase [Paenibacillus dendritiformis]MBG9791424.1 transposase [Paenibacillus dendritiformis]MBG9792773.1 transposase [Paenibacillus dendritiformis]MBG9793204.1 transposase [Paenibacillus dendritiformis]MBG9793991.1 transposase [Paenibacillus dendritiformis]
MKSTTPVSKIKTEFSLRHASSVGGSKVFLEYLEKIELDKALQNLSNIKHRHSLFPVFRILLYLIIGWTLGCERLFHFRALQQDALVQRFLGGRCPHHTLLYKELNRFGKQPTFTLDLRKLNQQVIAPGLPDELIMDLDSTVETVFGHQKGAAVGTNPHKPGRKSYHPLLAYEGQSRLCLNAVLRAGNTHSSTNAADFLRQTFELLGDRPVKYARFDKGFGGEDFYGLWESKGIGYVGKLKWTQRLQAEVQRCSVWKRFVDEEWIIEGIVLVYKATSWKKARRVAVIRKAQVYDGDQSRLLLDTDWQYEAIVTSLEWEPIDLWHFYNQRCCMENHIKEAKRGFSINRISTSRFTANEIDLLIKLLAYNLYERFKRDCCEPVHHGYTIARFRQEFFLCAATIIQHSRQVILKLARDFPNRYTWLRIATKVAALE